MQICDNPKTCIYVRNIGFLYDEKVFNKAYEIVTQERKSKVDGFRQQADRCRSLCAELLLRDSLKDFCGFDAEPDIGYGLNQKPYLKNAPEIQFNISHSGEYVICAVSECEVGCDIQKIGEAKGSELKLAERYFTEKENEYILNGVDSTGIQSRFYEMWVLKESYIKACGGGMAIPLNSFEIIIDKDATIISDGGVDKKYLFYTSEIDSDYNYAVCILLIR